MNILDYGGNNTGGDNTPAWNLAMLSDKELYFPSGTYLFNSAPDPVIAGKRVVGAGWFSSDLVCNYTPSAGDTFIRVGGSTASLSRFSISRTSGSGGTAIRADSTDASVADWSSFDHLLVRGNAAGTATWARCFSGDGTTRSSGMGLRDLSFNNCSFIDSTEYALYVAQAINLTIFGGGVFQGAGSQPTVKISGTASRRSQRIVVDSCVAGKVNLEFTDSANIGGVVDVSVIVDTSSTQVLVLASGLFSLNSTNPSVTVLKPGSLQRAGNSTMNFYVNGGVGFAVTQPGVTPVNNLQVRGNVASNAPSLEVVGPGADIDLRLSPKGTGLVMLGSTISTGDVPCSGYLTIKDAAGNLVKLMKTN